MHSLQVIIDVHARIQILRSMSMYPNLIEGIHIR